MNTIFSYLLMVAATLGTFNVPCAIYYEHPRLILAHYFRWDLW